MNDNGKFEYNYDFSSDALSIDIHNDLEYYDTLTLDKNIIIDVDKNKSPLSIEILNVSKVLDIEKNFLTKSSLHDLQIKKEEEKIIISIVILSHVRNTTKITSLDNYVINEGSNELLIKRTIDEMVAIS
nr:DUF2283 domain-containing protein [Methanobrevibacter arboriphilus]